MRDTIDMAREAGWKDLRAYDSAMRHDFFMGNTDSLKAFEALVRADERSVEREACAKVAEGPAGIDDEEAYWGREIAKAIRARGNT